MRKINKKKYDLRVYTATIMMCAKQRFDGGIMCVIAEYIVYFLQFQILCLIWRSLAASGADLGGMELPQLLTYTLLSSVFRQQLDITTPATAALWEGSIIGRYTRPMPVIGSMIAETIGKDWIAVFLFYSLPLLVTAPLFGISSLPVEPLRLGLGLLSLFLSTMISFAVDMLFSSLAMWMKNGCWAAIDVRDAIFSLLAGTVIPFSLFPWGLGNIFKYLPIGSIGNAPLAIMSGLSDAYGELIGLQLFWAVVLWIIGLKVFGKSKERMVSYGG